MLLKTASMTRNGLLKPVKPSATRDESNQPAPNSSTEASRSSLWKQACPEGKINYASNLLHEASRPPKRPRICWPLGGGSPIPADNSQRMARVDHRDENWTLLGDYSQL